MSKGDDSISKKGGKGGNVRFIITSNSRNAGFLVTSVYLALESEGSLKPQRVDPGMESRRTLYPGWSIAICSVLLAWFIPDNSEGSTITAVMDDEVKVSNVNLPEAHECLSNN